MLTWGQPPSAVQPSKARQQALGPPVLCHPERSRGTLGSPVLTSSLEVARSPVPPKSCQAPWTAQFLPSRRFSGRNKSENLAGLPLRIC